MALREGFIGNDDERDKPKRMEAVADKPKETATDEVAAILKEDWPLVIKLKHKSIKNDVGHLIDEISLREPTTADLIRAGGNPVRTEIGEITNGQAIFIFHIDDQKMFKLISATSGIMEAFLQKMDPRDYTSAAYRLRRFFIPEQGIW
jgi:hypothetical protein